MGALLRDWCGTLLLLVGGITGIAVALVGVFPVDHPLHQVVAISIRPTLSTTSLRYNER